MRILLLLAAALWLAGADYSAPAGIRPAIRRPGAAGILPGGRVIAPLGRQYVTGPGPFGLASSASGKMVATANSGPGVYSLTMLESGKRLPWTAQQIVARESDAADWPGVAMGVAFADERTVYAAEGNSGRVRQVDLSSGVRRRLYDVNQDGFADSYTGDLAYDAQRGLLYVVDQANFRLVVIDTSRHRVASSVRLGGLPYALALSPDGHKVYVTDTGVFESREANSVCVVSVEDPAAPKVEAWVRTGAPGSGPSAAAAAGDRVYVASAHSDSVTVIDARTNSVAGEIPIRIPGLENLRGVLPMGLAYHERSGWLLVAEAGINAVGVIDTRAMRVLGHLPVSWFPTKVLVRDETVFVTNARGQGAGPNVERNQVTGDVAAWDAPHLGSLSVFPLPPAGELAAHTSVVMEANGFRPKPAEPAALPAAIRHVVLIVKEGRSFDEVFGDIERVSNGPVVGLWPLARFGRRGLAMGGRDRLSVKGVNITPNHHALALGWSFSDNFYADSETDADGRLWLAGSYPDAWTASALAAGKAPRLPETEAIWRHLEEHRISFRSYGDFDARIPDQHRAGEFIKDVEDRYVKGGEELPRYIFIHLPGDRMAEARGENGYPFRASYVAENDYALGRIVEYLSGTKWWREMAIFVTEDTAQGGHDHIDAHRTLLLGVGPYFKRNYVSHVNTSFPGLLKTVFRLLGLPPLNLFDAAASDLGDCFTAEGDFASYKALDEDPRIFVPGKAK